MRKLTVMVVDSNDIQRLENLKKSLEEEIFNLKDLALCAMLADSEDADSYYKDLASCEKDLAIVEKQLAVLKKAGEEYDYLVALEARFYQKEGEIMNIKSFLLGLLFTLLATFAMATTGMHNKDVIDLNQLESITQDGNIITLTTTSGDSYQLVKQLVLKH